MKKVFLFLVVVCCSCIVNAQSPVAADFGKLEWLQGSWKRTNARPGRSGYERWTKLSSTAWQGTGVTMRGTDTAVIEKLQLVIKDDNIYYVADIPENKTVVYFKFTAISNHGFVCENPEHDFPKMISYEHKGNTIKAVISGNGKSVEYLFEKE
jgi:hypothetical protein